MLHIVNSYEFLDVGGELGLMTDRLTRRPISDPVLLVSAVKNTAYLHRASHEVYAFADIEPAVMRRLRRQEYVIVAEIDGDHVARSYDAPAGPLEYDEDAWLITKALSIVWHRFARLWTGAIQSRR